jgi:hypothetical protein
VARTYTQLRQLTAQQTGLLWYASTVDALGSSVSILRDSSLTRYGEDKFNGYHLLVTSGSPSYTELIAKDFFGDDGDIRFEPELGAAPSELTYEILPFSGTDFLRAIVDAIYFSYDQGWISRHHWSRIIGGSPIYNADFSYWTSATAVDGWTATSTTPSRERSSSNLALSETSIGLTTAVGYVSLDALWQRYLQDFKGSPVTLFCNVIATNANNARISLYNGSENYSGYHSGSGNPELLHVTVDTAKSDASIQPRLYTSTTTTAYFNLPFISGGSLRSSINVREYPFTIATMPDGPSLITAARMNVTKDEFATGRGLGTVRQLSRQRTVLGGNLVQHHDENTTTQVGVLDFTSSPRPPMDEEVLWLRGDGPLTVPTSALSTDNLEVTEGESLLLATIAAMNLIQRAQTGKSQSVQRSYSQRVNDLQRQLEGLISGAGQARDVATYSIGW